VERSPFLSVLPALEGFSATVLSLDPIQLLALKHRNTGPRLIGKGHQMITITLWQHMTCFFHSESTSSMKTNTSDWLKFIIGGGFCSL